MQSLCNSGALVYIFFGVLADKTMAARGHVNGRGPPRSGGRDSAKRVVLASIPQKIYTLKHYCYDNLSTLWSNWNQITRNLFAINNKFTYNVLGTVGILYIDDIGGSAELTGYGVVL